MSAEVPRATGSRVLVVDDDEHVRRLARLFLENEGCVIDFAEDGDAAVTAMLNVDYDVVVLDLMLPRRNGFEVAEVIRALARQPRLVILSALARYFGDRFDPDVPLLQKPIVPEELRLAVRAALDEGRGAPAIGR